MEIRLLTREEAATVPGMVDPMPSSLFALGAVDEDGVAACIGCFLVLHADPIWVRPDKRHSAHLLVDLWEKTRAEIVARNLAPELFVGMTGENPGQPTESVVERMCWYAGGNELDARFFVIPVEG